MPAVEADGLGKQVVQRIGRACPLQPAKVADSHTLDGGPHQAAGHAQHPSALLEERRRADDSTDPLGEAVKCPGHVRQVPLRAAHDSSPSAYSAILPSGCTVTSWVSSWNESTARS